MTIRVLVCDELPIVRDGLRTLLDADPDIEVVDATDSGIHTLMLVRTLKLDVVVTGLNLHGLSGLELIRRLGKETVTPKPRVVVFAMNDSDEMVTRCSRRRSRTGWLTGFAAPAITLMSYCVLR